MEFILRFLLDHEVCFRDSGNAELTVEVGILVNGKAGILTPREKFSAREVRKVRRTRSNE